ncbi:MAG: multiheme c-type cytochrome [Nitrospinota bacterium]|nr:multiheme c-type cytochrome [Nitrospinota bacterium]
MTYQPRFIRANFFHITASGLASLFLLANWAGAQPDKIVINEKGFTSSEVCGKCHVQMYQSWKESMHAGSVTDPIFEAAYMMAFYKKGAAAAKLCLRCHSPTSTLTKDYDLSHALPSEGITCDFCHSIKDVNLEKEDNPFTLDPGKVKYGPNIKGDVKVHDVMYSRVHSDAKICAGCHEYRPGGVPVMTTYSEWKDSVYPEQGTNCQYCHMPESVGEISKGVPGPREGKIFNHNLAGGHSVIQLKKALALKITAIERNKDKMTVRVDLTNQGSGHRVPTGIPTRKLILYCEVKVGGGKVYKDQVLYEKAIFGASGKELVHDADIMLGEGAFVAKDNRIFPKETRKEAFVFFIPEGKEALVNAWVDYLYDPVILQPTEMRIEMNRDSAVSTP